MATGGASGTPALSRKQEEEPTALVSAQPSLPPTRLLDIFQQRVDAKRCGLERARGTQQKGSYVSIPEIALRRTHPVWTLQIEVRAPHAGGYVVLSATSRGAAGVDNLVSLEMASTPMHPDVMCEYESAILAALENAVAGIAGLQPELPLV